MTCKDWRQIYEQLADKYFEATGELCPTPINPQTGKPLDAVIIAPSRLEQWYLRDGMRLREIAELLGCSVSTVSSLLEKAGIPTRNPSEYPRTDRQIKAFRENFAKAANQSRAAQRAGEVAHAKRMARGYEFGGAERHTKRGYVMVYAPEHPRANKSGDVPKHTLVMERHLGRYLEDDEVVHHINHVRDDNRIENLQLMKIREHREMHGREIAEKCRKPEEEAQHGY